MLYLIGLGLGDKKDLTARAVEILGKCSDIYIEEYTSKYTGSMDIAKNIQKLDREQIESDFLIKKARNKDIALLVCGDPLSATTHIQLFKDCRDAGIECQIVHNASIMIAVAVAGLSLYKYGRATTLCFPQKNWNPDSPYKIIAENQKTGLHTLVLLDTRNGREFMTCEQGHKLLLEHRAVKNTDKLIFCYALGSEKEKIEYTNMPTGGPVPACIVVPGRMDDKEQEFAEMWGKNNE